MAEGARRAWSIRVMASLPTRVRRSQVSARMSFQFPSSVKRAVIAVTSFSRAAAEKAANHLVATCSTLTSLGASTPRRSRVGRVTSCPMDNVEKWSETNIRENQRRVVCREAREETASGNEPTACVCHMHRVWRDRTKIAAKF